MRWLVAGLLISSSLAGGCRAGDLHDGFDSGSSDPASWSFGKFVGGYPSRQVQPLFPGSGGTAGAISIVTTDADGGNDCPLEEMPAGGCQRVLAEPAPAVRLLRFGADGLEFQLQFWIQDPQNGQSNVRSDVNVAMLKGLRAAGIDIPYPQRVVHVVQSPPVDASAAG